MDTHDPRQMIEDLRNHLATHDRGLAFLFGSGTSSSVNISSDTSGRSKPKHEPLIPGIDGLTDGCRVAVCKMGKSQAEAWDMLVKQCKQNGNSINIENVLSKIRVKIDALGDGETLIGLKRKDLSDIESKVCSVIAKTVNPDEKSIPLYIPHDDFALWVKKVNRTAPLEIFTTNYDILFERAFEKARIPVFDGFVGTCHPFFYPECLVSLGMIKGTKNRKVKVYHRASL